LAGVFQYVKENKTAVYFPGLCKENRLQFYPSEDVFPFEPQIQSNNRVVLLKTIDPSTYKIQSQRNLVRNYERNALKYMQDRNATKK